MKKYIFSNILMVLYGFFVLIITAFAKVIMIPKFMEINILLGNIFYILYLMLLLYICHAIGKVYMPRRKQK
jgi:hypothetical protein